MIDNIRKEFIQILKETDWLDDESRSLALAKVYNYEFNYFEMFIFDFIIFYSI